MTGFISGMALGVDLWAAQIILDLREKNPMLKLYCALPCEGQEKKWPADKQALYHSILKQADDIHWESKTYTPDCLSQIGQIDKLDWIPYMGGNQSSF